MANKLTIEILEAFRDDLKGMSGRPCHVTAHSPQSLVKESGVPSEMFMLKILPSTVDVRTGANRAENEIHQLEITTFVRCNDSFSDKEEKYKLMLNMSDQVRDWVFRTDPSVYSTAIYWVSYEGVSKLDDDKKGYYALSQRVKFETDLTLYGIGDMAVEQDFVVA